MKVNRFLSIPQRAVHVPEPPPFIPFSEMTHAELVEQTRVYLDIAVAKARQLVRVDPRRIQHKGR